MRPMTEVQRTVLLVAVLASFLTPFTVSAVNIALPAIGREFCLGTVALGWVSSAYLLAAAVFLVPFGRLADIHGRKRMFITGIWVYTGSCLVVPIAPTGSWLIAGRVLQGLGAAMTFGTGVAILTSVFPPGERGRVLGYNVSATYLGLSLGPFLGGLLTQAWGWRSLFLVQVPLGLLIAALVLWKLKDEWAEARGEAFDGVGSLLYGAGLVSLILGFSSLPGWRGAGLLLVGFAGLGAFLAWEAKAESPVLELRAFRANRVFLFSNLAALINYSATFAVGFLLSLYLQTVKGLPPRTAGLVLVAQPVIMALFSPAAGRLSDRIEPRIVASLGMGVTVVGLLMLVFLKADAPLWYVVASLMLLGFGFALFSSPNTNAVMGSVEKRVYGVASATLGTMRLVGQTLSMAIAMVVFSVFAGSTLAGPGLQPGFLKSSSVIFGIMTVLCAAGTFASLVRGKVR